MYNAGSRGTEVRDVRSNGATQPHVLWSRLSLCACLVDIMSDEIAKAQEVFQKIADSYQADIIVFAGPVAIQSERRLNDAIRTGQRRDNVLLLLSTLGGSADVAYQIVRCLQRNYDTFVLFVDSACKSAGTLMALGANQIIMSDTAELGPLDIQVQRPGELGEYISGLTPIQSLDTLRREFFAAFEDYFLTLRFRSGLQISTRMAADVAAQMAVGAFSPIYGQFDPLRLADNVRANMIALEYGQRIRTTNVKDDTIERLIAGYPSHSFVIDRSEATQLFENVRAPTKLEFDLANFFHPIAETAIEQEETVIRLIPEALSESGDTNEAGHRETGKVPQTADADNRTAGEQTLQAGQDDSAHSVDRNNGTATGGGSESRDTTEDPGPTVTDSDKTAGAGVEPAPG